MTDVVDAHRMKQQEVRIVSAQQVVGIGKQMVVRIVVLPVEGAMLYIAHRKRNRLPSSNRRESGFHDKRLPSTYRNCQGIGWPLLANAINACLDRSSICLRHESVAEIGLCHRVCGSLGTTAASAIGPNRVLSCRKKPPQANQAPWTSIGSDGSAAHSSRDAS